MLKLVLVLGLQISAVLLLYCSNKHQRLLAMRLAQRWRFVAVATFSAAGGFAAWQLSTTAAIFFMVLILMLTLILVPLLSLLCPNRLNNQQCRPQSVRSAE